jgi:hypothetical protein
VPLCQQPNFECLIVGSAGAEASFEMQRYTNISLFENAQADLEALDEQPADETVTAIIVGGHDAIERIIRVGDPTRYLLLIRDGSTVVRFYLAAPPSAFDSYLDDIDSFVSSIRFSAP